MKKFFILLLVQTVTLGLWAQNNLQNATDAYSKGEYSKAIEIYENALKENGESAAVYFNLGNCYYKMDKIGPAILNYERSLLLNPGDEDARFNLEIAKLKTTDKIEPIDLFFLTDWTRAIQNLLSTNTWSYFGICTFLLLIGCLFLFFFSRKIFLKKVGFYAGIGFLVITMASNIFAYNQKKKLTDRNTAIIFAATITLKSSPDNSGTDLFVLHEGTKVTIKSKLGEWSEVVIADGHIGWIKSDEIVVI